MSSRLAMALSPSECTGYADATAYVRVREKRDLLNQGRLNDLLGLEPSGIVARSARGMQVEEETGPSLDAALGQALAADYREVEGFDHDGRVVPILRCRHDVHNLKSLLRKKLTGLAPRFSPVPGALGLEELEESVARGRKLDWPAPLNAALERLRADGGESALSLWGDLVMDAAWIEAGLWWCASQRLPLLSHYFNCLGDMAAIRLAWRAVSLGEAGVEPPGTGVQTHYLDAGILRLRDRRRLADALQESFYGPALKEGLAEWAATGWWAKLDRDMDDFLTGELKGAKYISFGPEPLGAFLLAREGDQRNVRLIYELKGRGWDADRIRAVLRRTYA